MKFFLSDKSHSYGKLLKAKLYKTTPKENISVLLSSSTSISIRHKTSGDIYRLVPINGRRNLSPLWRFSYDWLMEKSVIFMVKLSYINIFCCFISIWITLFWWQYWRPSKICKAKNANTVSEIFLLGIIFFWKWSKSPYLA